MDYSIATSTAALLISFGSLAVSFAQARRDSPKLQVHATFMRGYEGDTPSIKLIATNSGRRPIHIRIVGGKSKESGWSGIKLNGLGGGHRLGENELYEKYFFLHDLVETTPDGEEIEFEKLILIDTLGKEYVAKNSANAINELRGLNSSSNFRKKQFD